MWEHNAESREKPQAVLTGDPSWSISLRRRLGGGRTSYQPSSPSRLSKETNQKNFNNLYGTKGNYTSRVWEYTSTVQNSEDMPTVQGNSSFSLKGFPSLLRSQVPKAQPQTWKSGKQTLLSHYRPFYVNKGSGIGSNEAP